MPVYHQMGHDTINLLSEPLLNKFAGAILSPVNYDVTKVSSHISFAQTMSNFSTIFDPQLYFPKSNQGLLRTWSYFPSDVDTAEISSERWWRTVVDAVCETCSNLNPTAACSPVFAPSKFSDGYFDAMISIGNYFVNCLRGTNIRPIQSIMVGINELSDENTVNRIASIITRTRATSIYLILVSSVIPRREFSNSDELRGAMQLISAVEGSGISVIVGYSSSDVFLWKAAGATSCATGKFFNLRRFTSSRFEESEGGGGQLPYWFEESLVAFLRESDLLRVYQKGMLSKASLANPFGQQILQQISSGQNKPWVGLSWRQYMYSFAEIEERIALGKLDVKKFLKSAEHAWLQLEDNNILMEEARNDGAWIRSWRRALIEFK